ncbi:prepilin-type N-terminal cleavage/methylation domain-containing protein [Vibrio fluvialis]|nr:prepilin-type N-terminal cleavage/methylation domain-containing protein [Vibrio fluvialis]MBY8292533.1 prepilin-type N-terminal cleavage/methylation domain-containing protein [Vibrio fluvialis]
MSTRGFTLIEMILTIIVGSILVLGIAGFVELGSRGYADTVARQRIQTQATFVLEKMTRELRHAVPNSIAISVDTSEKQCVSFFPIVYSGFYALNVADDKQLSFIVGNLSGSTDSLNFDGLTMFINPSRQSELVSEKMGISLNPNDLSDKGMALEQHKDESGRFVYYSLSPLYLKSQSVGQRFYMYPNKLVEYCLQFAKNSITREVVQLPDTRVMSDAVQVADSMSSGAFAYDEPTLQRGGVVHLSLAFAQNGEVSEFEQDVQVLNVP